MSTRITAAAAFGVTYRTAYHALRSVAQVAERDWVVILGAAGELQQMFAEGRIRRYIGARFPLSDTASALRYVADRKAIGKVVIDVTA
jgi:NADPH:quinone reductase-like Zn-dependent oxidoreductase